MTISYSQPWSTQTALGSASGLNSLASGTYVSLGDVDLSSIDPLDVSVDLQVTPGVTTGLEQVSLFAKVSWDGSNWSSGPESGTTTTDEGDLYFLGALPLRTDSTVQRKSFPIMAALGFVPPWIRIIAKNETGAALAGSGNAANYATLLGLGT